MIMMDTRVARQINVYGWRALWSRVMSGAQGAKLEIRS